MVGVAALQENVVNENTVIVDKGLLVIPNQFNPSISYNFYGWKRNGLGPMNVRSAIAESSDIYFYTVTGVTTAHLVPYQATVNLTGGAALNVIWAAATVNKYLQAARLTLAASPVGNFAGVRESPAHYDPQVALLARKLADVIQDLIELRQTGQP
jgi:hypothetical protein